MLIWLAIIAVAGILEAITTDLVSIWIVFGGLTGLVMNILECSLKSQIIGCVVVTLLTIIIIRPVCAKYLKGNVVKTNIDRLIGKRVILEKEISSTEKGMVKINGESWNAISVDHYPISKGTAVSIVAIDGNKLIVKE